jgi:hypothetical protein
MTLVIRVDDRKGQILLSIMKVTLSRVISLLSLTLAITALVLVFRKPATVSVQQPVAVVAANAQSFQSKIDQLSQAQADGQKGTEVRLNSDEVRAAIAQAAGAVPAMPAQPNTATSDDLAAAVGSGSIDLANLPEPMVSFEGDQLKGQFLTEVQGRKVYVTVAGHIGAKNGYASFEPTEFKIGDLNVPVSLVNDALQKKMLEQRDRLKLPDYVSDIRVENGELVIKQK